MTNYERIKAMDVEELARFFVTELEGTCGCCAATQEERRNRCWEAPDGCAKGVAGWLSLEAKQ